MISTGPKGSERERDREMWGVRHIMQITHSLWGISSSCSTDEGTAAKRAIRAKRGTTRPIPLGLRQQGDKYHGERVHSCYWRRLN